MVWNMYLLSNMPSILDFGGGRGSISVCWPIWRLRLKAQKWQFLFGDFYPIANFRVALNSYNEGMESMYGYDGDETSLMP